MRLIRFINPYRKISTHSEGTITRVAGAVAVCLLLLSAFPYNGESGKPDPAPVQSGTANNVIL